MFKAGVILLKVGTLVFVAGLLLLINYGAHDTKLDHAMLLITGGVMAFTIGIVLGLNP